MVVDSPARQHEAPFASGEPDRALEHVEGLVVLLVGVLRGTGPARLELAFDDADAACGRFAVLDDREGVAGDRERLVS